MSTTYWQFCVFLNVLDGPTKRHTYGESVYVCLLQWAMTQERTSGSVFQIFEQIRDSANRMAKTEACAEWTFACGRIIAATRKVEELLSGPGNTTAIFDPAHADNDSELLTHPTAPSAPQPAFSASITTDTRAHLEEETCKLPVQELEEELLVLRAKHPQKNHPNLEKMLRRLGELSMLAGDLTEATQHLEESLRIHRAVHGDRDHPAVGATLHALGQLSRRTGDSEKAQQYLEEALRIHRALHGDKNHRDVGHQHHDDLCLHSVHGLFSKILPSTVLPSPNLLFWLNDSKWSNLCS